MCISGVAAEGMLQAHRSNGIKDGVVQYIGSDPQSGEVEIESEVLVELIVHWRNEVGKWDRRGYDLK